MIGLLFSVALAATPDNPHGSPEGCPACHEPAPVVEVDEEAVDDEGEDTADEEAPAAVGPARPATPTCLRCHPTADMHPVGVTPVTTEVPDGWPLEDGAVTCATCHVEPAHAGVDPELPRPWHREGPYTTSLALCDRCHDLDELERVDPHHKGMGTAGRDAGCAACHTSMPEQGATMADARLRTAPERLCDLCHEGPVHAGAREHVGRTVGTSLGWPTWPAGQVACFTCHDVHEGGSAGHLSGPLASQLQALAGVPAADRDREHPPLLVLPLARLCPSCHGVGP